MYQADEVNGSGYINALYFKYGSTVAADVTCNNITIKLGHTSRTNATGLLADLTMNANVGSLVTVLNNATITIPAGTGGNYFKIPLTDTFNYNGVDNLLVDFGRTTLCTADVNPRAEIGYPNGKHAASVVSGTPDTGTLANAMLHMKFDFAGGDNTQDFGGTNGITLPFSTLTPRTQNLYLASEIDGSGSITGLAFQMSTTSTAETYTATIMMGHTTLTALGTTFAANFDSGTPVTVANAITFNIPDGIPAGEWFWVPLPTNTFLYNGTDNLIVDVVTTAATGNTSIGFLGTTGRRNYNNDNTAPDGAVDTAAVHVKFRFNGGTMGVITDAALGTSNAFSNSVGGRANLYRSTELGTAAQIKSVACRMEAATSTATTLNNYKIIMGHTLLDSLDATAANNFISQSVVYDGAFSIPAGLVQGDWITVPLTTPFNYNGTDNLVIWMGTTAASGGITHRCELSSADARFPNHSGTGPPDSINIAGIGNVKFDMRLGISK